MKIAVLGTGPVGHSIGSKLAELGHLVMMGSRSVSNEKAQAFAAKFPGTATAGTFAEAADFGELVFNCTAGMKSVDALKMAGEKNLNDKILVDVANPLDFSGGNTPILSVANTNSLAEEIQKMFPRAKVVKSFNTMWSHLMVNPALVNGGDHNIFCCGNDPDAKEVVKQLIKSFGWSENNIIDLGDITAARGTEMYLVLWMYLYNTMKNSAFNIKIQR